MREKIIKLLLLAVLLAATGFASYKGVIAIWGEQEIASISEGKQGTGSTEKQAAPVKDMLVTAYFYDNYTKGVIEYCAVRFFNVNTKECNYVFFPGNTKITLSDETFQTLHNASTHIKQEVLLRDIATWLAQDSDRYQYTTMAIQDAIGYQIDYYEAITSDNVIRIVNLIEPVNFDVPKKMSFKDDSNINIVLKKGVQTLLGDQVKGMLTKPELYKSEMERLECSINYIKAYMSAVTSFTDRDTMGTYYQDYYSLLETNASFMEMRPYMDYLYQVKPDNIITHTAQGKEKGGEYTIDKDALQATVKTFLVNTTPEETTGAEATTEMVSTEEAATTEETTTEEAVTTEEVTTEEPEEATTEEEEPDITDSKKLKIEIYNSTTINGLAAKWQKKLEDDGYKISKVETERGYHLKECVIYVKEEGQGEDLLKYFPKAEIKVGVLKSADIRIVLGTNNKNVK